MEEVIHHFEHLLGFMLTKLKKTNKNKTMRLKRDLIFFVTGLMPIKDMSQVLWQNPFT